MSNKLPLTGREEYYRKLSDPRWQRVRLHIFDRDGWECQRCGIGIDGGKTFHVHHKKYTADDPWEEPPENLETLCEDCHATEHDTRAFPVEELELRITHLRKTYSMAHRMIVKVIGEAEALAVIQKGPEMTGGDGRRKDWRKAC